MNLSRYISFKEEVVSIISEVDIDEILSIHSLPVNIESEHLNFDRALVKQFTLTLPKKEQARALALLLDYSTVIDTDPAMCEFSVCLRQLVAIGYFTPQLLRRNQFKFLENVKIILGRVFSESSNNHFSHQSSMALSFAITPLAKRMKDIDITNPRYKIYQDILELLLELHKGNDFFTVKDITRFLPFFFNSIGAFHSDSGVQYTATQLQIFNDLLDLLYKYVDKSNTMDISVNEIIQNLLQIISTKSLPISPSTKLIAFINSMSQLSEEISSFIFVPERCQQIAKFIVNTIKTINSSSNPNDKPYSETGQKAILEGDKNFYTSINHPTTRTFSEDIPTIPISERTTKQKVTSSPATIPSRINENASFIQIILGIMQFFNPSEKVFRTEFHKSFIECFLGDEELRNMPIFPYFMATWLYQFIVSDSAPLLETLHETNFYYTLYDYVFAHLDDAQLQDFVLNVLFQLINKPHTAYPYYLSDFLNFLCDYSKSLQIDSKIFACLNKIAIASTLTFIRGCTLADFSSKLANILSELFYLHSSLLEKDKNEDDRNLLAKVEKTRRQFLEFVDNIDTFPSIFQYLYDNVYFAKVILCHFYDQSTINFASNQLILLFQQFTATSNTFLFVIKFFSSLEITKPVLLILLQCCSRGFDANPYEIADIFNDTNFLDFLIDSSVRLNCEVSLKIFLDIFSKMTAKPGYFSFKFDIFLKVERLITYDFDTKDLWKIVFNDDKGQTTPRKIVNVLPISLLFAISIKKNEINRFIDFIKKCFEFDQYVIYDLCQTELPSRILTFLSEYRTKEKGDDQFKKVFDFFVSISVYSMKNSDLCSMIRLCTSLPGHKRPFFTIDVVHALEKLLKETEDLPPAFFDLCGEKTYLQLPNVPVDIVNNEFALYFDLRFLKDKFYGTIVEFSNSKSKFSIKINDDKMEVVIKSGRLKQFHTTQPITLDTTKFNSFIIEYKKNCLIVKYIKTYNFQHNEIYFDSEFNYFKALDNVPCQLSRTFLLKKITVPKELSLLDSFPYSPVSSFHPTESVRFPPVYSSLFTKSIAPDFLYIFNAQISLKKKFAINLIDSSTMRVTGRIIQTEPQLLMLLDSIGGFLSLMPFFGQIEQPLVGQNEAHDNILPTLLLFISSVCGMSVHNQQIFRKVRGAKILAFLLSLVSLEKIQADATIDAICELFSKTNFVPLAIQYIDSILLNFNLWIYLPVDKQKTIYTKFTDLIMERLSVKSSKFNSNDFNISKILKLIRVYLWANRSNSKICLGDDCKMDITGQKVEGKRPENCAPIRNFFWEFIKKLSNNDFLREEDFKLLISFCSDTTDLEITKESIDLFSYLITRKNPVAVKYMKENYRFSTFFELFKVPDSQLLKKLFKIYLDIDNSFLRPFKKEDWDTGIVRDIDCKSIDLDFLKIIERNMIKPRETHLSAHDTANLTISMPRFIPLYLLSIQSQDEENMMKYFDLIDDLMKMDARLLTGNWDYPFLLLLMSQMPNENCKMNEISKNTIELLAFLYNKSCRNTKPRRSSLQTSSLNSSSSVNSNLNSQFFTMPQYIQIISYQAKKDYSHITRLIYIEFLKKENFFDRPYSLIDPATFNKIFLQISKFLMLIPNFDVSCNDVNYSYQDLLKFSQSALDSSKSSSEHASMPTSGSADSIRSVGNQLSEANFSFDDSVLNSDSMTAISPPSYFQQDAESATLLTANSISSFSLNSTSEPISNSLGSISMSNFNANIQTVTNGGNIGISPLVSDSNFQALNSPNTPTNKQEHVFNRHIHKLFNFNYGYRESNGKESREWKDGVLAAFLVDALITRAQQILSIKEKPTVNRKKTLHSLELLGLFIEAGLSFPTDSLEFANLGELALSRFQTTDFKSHIKRSISYIFSGLAKAVIDSIKSNSFLTDPNSKKIAEILLRCSDTYSEFLQKECKVTIPKPIPKLEDINFEAIYNPIFEIDTHSHFQGKTPKLIKNEIEKNETQIHLLSKKLTFTLQLIPKLKSGELSKDVSLRNNLEQFALLQLNGNVNSMKTYKKLFRNLSSQNGPWQTPEVKIIKHRRLSNSIFGWCHYFMKPNYKFTNHKDASLLRDMGSKEEADLAYNQSVSKERLLEFKGDLALVAADKFNSMNASVNTDDVLLKLDACSITMNSVNSGKLSVTRASIFFDSPNRFIQIPLDKITKIFLRRYLHINSAIEIFTSLKKSYFFDFPSVDQRTLLLEFLNERHIDKIKFIQMKDEDIQPLLNKATHSWQIGKLTNFEYLLKLNKYAGRTYHDLSQYPVFPWIIADYTSDVLDLTKQESFRDLTKPMGAMNEERLNNLKSRITSLEDTDESVNFLYGAFYSSSATVIGYMIRMEPFTSLHIELQNGKFDVPDRLFVSIPEAWESATTSQMDFRELTPEFYYLPDFLVNENKLDLGVYSKTNERIDDVILPKWASSPLDFISKNRQALEDPFVTLTLPQWINLIFGPNSRLPNAEKVNNVFHPFYYETSIIGKSESEIEVIREHTACFGSAPLQLFFSDPPQRDFSPILFKNAFFGEEKSIQLCKNSAIIALSPDCGNVMNIALNSDLDFFIGGQEKGHLQLKIPKELEDTSKVEQKAIVSTHSAVVSLPWDCAIFIFRFEGVKSEPAMISRTHNKKITAMAICDQYIATGSEDCTIRIWDNIKMKHLHCISKHRSAISALEINEKLRICVAVSVDGYVSVNSLVNWNFSWDCSIDLKEASSVDISDFGFIIIAQNGPTNGSSAVVYDQNLKFICNKDFDASWLMSKVVAWNDGLDYLAVAMSDNKIHFFILPFLTPITNYISTSDYTVTSLTFHKDQMRMLIGDSMGKIHIHRFLH